MVGKYEMYSEYKSIESVFLSKIPAAWVVKPLYTLCEFRQGKAHEPFIDDDGKYICVNARFVSTQGGSSKRCTVNLTPARSNDILMVMSDLPSGRALARAFYVKKERNFAVNQRIAAITTKNIDSKFLYYQLDRSPYFLMFDDGANQTHLSNDAFKKFPVLVPSSEEQQKIASFLDHETAKIDTLIDKQQQLIQLLKEKRQAVISHAVTKGLNPNAPMRDSGVEWLGEVPEHWEVVRLKYICDLISKKVEINGHEVIALENIEGWTGKYIKTDSSYSGQDVEFIAGDILFGKLRPYLAKVYLAKDSGVAFGDLLVYRPRKELLNKYVFYLMTHEGFINNVDSSTYGSKMPRASTEFVSEMPVVIPPMQEQEQIVAYVDNTLERFDSLVLKAESAIELMQERRTALISAAVTGKIDVRHHASHPTGGLQSTKSTVHGDL